MVYVNSHTVCGSVGSEPESKPSSSGHKIARFSLALNKGKNKPTQWIRVSCFGQAAEFAMQYIHTGDTVIVIGETTMHQWEKDGVKKAELQIDAQQVKLVYSRQPKRAQEQTHDDDHFVPPPPDDIPF